jgi:hypothetical protein
MRNRNAIVAVLAIAALAACTFIKNENQNENQPVVIGGPSSLPSPGASTPPPGCAAVDRVTVSLVGGTGVLHVGAAPVRLDVTPRSATGEPLDSACHGTSVQWQAAGTALCSLSGDISGFGPSIACTTAGVIKVTATVSSPGGEGEASWPVQ